MERNKRNLAYLAGLFDGEGGITAAGSVSRFYPRAYIGTTTESAMRWVQRSLGGILTPRKIVATYNRKIMWYVCWTNAHDVARMLKSLLPWLRIKRALAKAAIQLAGLIGTKAKRPRIQTASLARRKRLHDRIKRLNGGTGA